MGADVRTLDDGITKAGWWWLRSPGEDSKQASFVNFDGTRYTNGVGNGYLSVRPALWIDLKNYAPTIETEKLQITEKRPIAVDGGDKHSAILYNDGTVITIGDNSYGQRNTEGWRNIVQISTYGNHTLGLTSSGLVVATGSNGENQCDVDKWEDIICVAAGSRHSVGLKKDGTVVAVGSNSSGQCNVENWKDITYVSANATSTFGLTKEGQILVCMKCMKELKPGENVCPECGQDYGSTKAEPFALRPGTILDGKYLVGEMLGQGGFGITYIGFDLLLEQKVAIKEYFPMNTGMVSRGNHSTVIWSSVVMQRTGVEKGFDSFLKEARKMARLGGIPGVVGVKSVFIQNETAYIVMDFVEGETLLKKLQREGPMDFDTCITLLTPIMKALAEVHTHGIIHRDISPDNIMVQRDGKLILLDLGAAKDLDIQGADGTVQSSQLVAKQGFSPIEQYGKSGKIGPWTDVYATAATIYYNQRLRVHW